MSITINMPFIWDCLTIYFQEITVLEKIACVEESLVGGYVVVNYDGMPYPGVVQAVAENDLEVQVS